MKRYYLLLSKVGIPRAGAEMGNVNNDTSVRKADRRVQRLFTPLTIGKIRLRNRIVSTAHSTGLSDEGLIGKDAIAYYQSRAAGGTGLIITGSTSVHPSSTSKLKPALQNWGEQAIPRYELLAEAVHAAGGTLFVQLNHAGALSGSGGPFGCVVGPSACQPEIGVEPAREITTREIEELLSAFAAAAIRVQASGLDGVEIHGGHGNLIQQFLSPHTNQRNDDYGGDPIRRMRFARDVLSAVRRAVGDDFVVGFRISAEEDYKDGLKIDDAVQIVKSLTSDVAISYINVTSGSDTSSASLPRHYAPMYTRSGHMLRLVKPIKAVTKLPVLAVGRITDPLDAEAILEAGDADLIGMTRALIADRDLANKARDGRLGNIRYCVGANEGCLGRLFRGQSVTCIQDPTSGREHSLGPIEPAAQAKNVVIVGGGVAGLEAARVAAVRGHKVTLFEKEHDFGGQIKIAMKAPGREDLGAIIGNLEREIRNLPIDAKLGTIATPDQISACAPNAVILATGSQARIPLELDDGYDRIFSARDALADKFVGESAVVYDTIGDYVAPTTVEYLAKTGRRVVLVSSRRAYGSQIEPMTLRIIDERLARIGVVQYVSSAVTALKDDGIEITNLLNGERHLLRDFVSVVAAMGSVPVLDLQPDLPTASTFVVGDARSPKHIESSIYDAHMIARNL